MGFWPDKSVIVLQYTQNLINLAEKIKGMAIAQLVNFNRKSIYILTLVKVKKKGEIFFHPDRRQLEESFQNKIQFYQLSVAFWALDRPLLPFWFCPIHSEWADDRLKWDNKHQEPQHCTVILSSLLRLQLPSLCQQLPQIPFKKSF